MTDDLTPAHAAAELLVETKGLRADVQRVLDALIEERKGRAGSQRLGRIAVLTAVLVVGLWANGIYRSANITCDVRNKSRADTRLMAVRVASSSVDVLGASEAQQTKVRENARKIALETLPVLAC
jgi:hypothetical protein